MTDDSDRISANAITGGFLVVAGVVVLIVTRDLVTSTVFTLIGVFFLTRALAQHRHG